MNGVGRESTLLLNDQALKTYKVVHFQPFDPVHKRTEASVEGPDGKAFKVTKGAPQVILALAADAAQVKAAVDKAVNEFATRGVRALGVARADADGKWQFQGVCPCSIRHGTMPRKPSLPRKRWA